jgi:excisionase family DNA binding protein
MREPARNRVIEKWPDDTSEARQHFEDGLKILARIIARAIIEEESVIKKISREPNGDAEIPFSADLAVQQQEKLTLTVTEAAKLLGLSRSLAYDAVRQGQIPSIRMGNRIVIPKAALARILREASSDKTR